MNDRLADTFTRIVQERGLHQAIFIVAQLLQGAGYSDGVTLVVGGHPVEKM